MKRKSVQIAMVIIFSVFIIGNNTITFAADSSTVQPMFTGVSSVHPTIDIDGLGNIICNDAVVIKSGYRADVTWKLQYGQAKNWVTSATWQKSGTGTIALSQTRYAIHGFKYRLEATVKVYNSMGVKVDDFTRYSAVVSY